VDSIKERLKKIPTWVFAALGGLLLVLLFFVAIS